MNDSYEDQDDYDSDCERKPKRNMLSNCANGLHIGDDSNNEDEDDDEFTRKYNKHYHKHFDNDYNDEDFDWIKRDFFLLNHDGLNIFVNKIFGAVWIIMSLPESRSYFAYSTMFLSEIILINNIFTF